VAPAPIPAAAAAVTPDAVQAPAAAPDAAQAPAAAPAGPGSAAPAGSIQVELIWGHDRRMCQVPAAGAVIGSTGAADLVVPAAFLSPRHAQVCFRDGTWQVEALTPGGSVLLHGKQVRSGPIAAGDVFRLADGVGNFVSVKVPKAGRARPRDGALRAPLPGREESYLIGSDARCQVRLDHPLVRPRHLAVQRDAAGTLWAQDQRTAAGTYVNGQRLRGRDRLAPGDVIQIGPFSARVGAHALEPLEQVAGIEIAVRGASVDTPPARRVRRRTLLHDVSLLLRPGSLTVVAGPSGAGKTTLMRLLSGQMPAARGVVEYNGADLGQCRQAFAALMGYVPQDDVVHADLTVSEALEYQARLRLGPGSSAGFRAARVTHVLGLVELTEQLGQQVKTLSGGQRKRVSIACELLSEPQVIFLDEPTSGLDPGLDKRMMLLLRLLADQGHTVVLTTHAIAHVDVCDTLVLVGPGGHVIYSGPPDEALDWFGVHGLGDVYSLVETAETAERAAARVRQKQAPAGRRAAPASRAGPVARGADVDLGAARPPAGSPAWRRAIMDQARILAGRHVRLIGRDRTALTFSLLQGIGIGLLTAVVAAKPFTWGLQGNAPGFVFGCASVWFGMIGAVRELVKERSIWRREFLAGGSLPAYLSAKVAVLGTVAAIQSLTLAVVIGLTLGLPTSSPVGGGFGSFFLSLWLANLCGMAVGLYVSAGSSNADRAMSVVPYLLITQLVLCGVLFRLGVLTFVSWLMPARWAVSAIGGIAGLSAAQLKQSPGLYPHSAAGLLATWLMLVVLAAAGIALTAWKLRRLGESWVVGSDAARRPGLSARLALRPAAAGPGGRHG
jgi:ABC-type multidrug transport system ATPase subunit